MKPKIILLDLEIIPNLKKALKFWPRLSSKWDCKTLKASVSSICCAGYRELHHKKAKTINAWDFEGWENDVNDDQEVCAAIYEIIKDADAIVSWNGKRFDFKYLQTRLLYHGFPFLPKIAHFDFCQIVKTNLMLIDNRLNTFSQEILGQSKLDHQGWDLWVETHNRVKKSMNLMAKYCRQDVDLLGFAYEKLLPLVNNHPNMNLFRNHAQMIEGVQVCPKCKGENLIKNGYKYTQTGAYQRLFCKDCNSNCRGNLKGHDLRAV